MIKKVFLIEIGTEELPAKLLYSIIHSFYENFINELKLHNIIYEKIYYFATPRRLALQILNLDLSEKIIEIYKRGPLKNDAFDILGNYTNAAKSWAKCCGININQAIIIKNKKNECLAYKTKKIQEKIPILFPKLIIKALKKINIKNTMRWNIKNHSFFRPIRSIVMLLDQEIIPGIIYGITSNNIIHNPLYEKNKKINIKHAIKYPELLLKKYKIIVNYNLRKNIIIENIKKIANNINGIVNIHSDLINEVTSLVEAPIVLLGKFQKKFLKIPEKILIYTIELHQKCFPIYNFKKKLIPYFIFIANSYSIQEKEIIQGHEKVIHARLSDTEFFFQNDRKKKLDSYLPYLKNVIFHQKIGTLYDKTQRIIMLSRWIAKYTKNKNIEYITRAARLSKCDLISNMVCEFPALQGIIGMYYALAEKEKKEIAIALQEQYLPSYSGDNLPKTIIGSILSIADKIDTLSGMFIIDCIPTSDKDPFAVRRITIGILRIIIQNNIPIDLKDIFYYSIQIYKININQKKVYNDIINFCYTRLFYWYQENHFPVNIIKSVLSYTFTKPIEINKRIQALLYFTRLKQSKKILISIKRICKILEKNKEIILENINNELIKEKTEKILLFHTINFNNDIIQLLKENKYKKILIKLCQLEEPIYNFFNDVKIYHIDTQIRINRLTLLNLIKKSIFTIANFSYLY